MTFKLVFPRTEDVAARVARNYSGMVHGVDSDGVMDIEFPSIHHAASFVRTVEWEDHSYIRSDENGVSVVEFNKSVVVQIRLGETNNE